MPLARWEGNGPDAPGQVSARTVGSGKLKKICADYAIMPDFVSYGPCEEYMPKPLRYRRNVRIILHLSNQVNDDIKATVHENTELQIEDEQ